jgi:hypothetical protein
MGPCWTLYYPDGSGGVRTFSIPMTMARTPDEAEAYARRHLTDNSDVN